VDVNVHINVVNGVASFELRQVYKNDQKNSLEIEYMFPINPEYSVTALNVQIGDKTVEGKVIKKEKAEEKYDDAIAAGHTAVKMDYDETTKGMMKMKVGNLLPEEEAIVKVNFLTALSSEIIGYFTIRVPQAFIFNQNGSGISGGKKWNF
jgi:hypothetical protein